MGMTKMRMLKFMLDVAKKDLILKNEFICYRLEWVLSLTSLRNNQLRWYGHVFWLTVDVLQERWIRWSGRSFKKLRKVDLKMKWKVIKKQRKVDLKMFNDKFWFI